jgi:aspartyl-tRNA(Asn)/glutamyl-tRNA(Gln) amidotransferase subunit A
VTVTRRRALAEARAAEAEIADGSWRGPLHGIPYAAKDLFDVAGEVTGAGTHLLAGNVASADATVVARLREAGMVLVGKTHTVQFAYGGVGINHDTGTPRNPWPGPDAEAHVPGGSSSGSGVAVSAGLVPMALGSDTSGSVRIPASLCGVTGLKTTVGRVSRAGVYPLSATLDSVGPLTRSVTDAALVYGAIQGADPADATTLAQSPHAVTASLAEGVEGMRLAFVETWLFDGVDPEVEAAVRTTADVFRDLGAEVVSVEVPELDEVLGTPEMPQRARTVAAEACAVNRRFLEESFDKLDPVVSTRMRKGFDVTAVEFAEAFDAWERIRRTFDERTTGIDAFLMPATPLPAHPVSEVDATSASYATFNMQYLANTSIGNRLRWCGPSVPCGFTEAGLPIGLMIQARAMEEHVALRVAADLQRSSDWHRRRPSA